MRHLRSSLFLVLLLATACGGATADTRGASSTEATASSHVDPEAYLLADTALMLRLDVSSLRQSALAEPIERWLAIVSDSLPHDAEARAGFASGLAWWRATDSILFGATLPSHSHDVAWVLVSSGHYPQAELASWAEALTTHNDLHHERRAGRLLVRSDRDDELTMLASDPETIVAAHGVPSEQLRQVADGSGPAHGPVDGLRALARESAFGEHTLDVCLLQTPEMREQLAHNFDVVMDSFQANASIAQGLDFEARARSTTAAEATSLLSHRAQIDDFAWRIGVSMPELARVLRSIHYRTEGSEAVARLTLDPAQLQALASSLDSSVAVALGLPASPSDTPSDAASNFALICQVATELEGEDVDPLSRAMEMAQRVEQGLTNPDVREAFRALANAAPEDKYGLLLTAARELGVNDWTCPALEHLIAALNQTAPSQNP